MSITVVGRGHVRVPADRAVVDLACEGTGPDPAAALAAASTGLEAVRRALLAGGVAETDLRSTDLGLWSETDPQGQPQGYRSSVALTATIRDVAAAGSVVGDAVAAGGRTSRLRGLRLQASGAEAARTAARDVAWADAEQSARQLARLADRSLGPVTDVVDGEPAGGGPGPIARAFATKDQGPGLDAGELEVAVAVTVTWELGQAG